MLLRTAWRRVPAAVRVAPGPKSVAPTRGLRLRGTLRALLVATVPAGADLPPWRGDAPEYYGASLLRPLPRPPDPAFWLHPSNFLRLALRLVDFAASPFRSCPTGPRILGSSVGLQTSPGQL
ncbi:hypothetical protein GH733_010180 [Mirounga leonina]|nr:hypothetical protein GH733_010180 [Mirounga leonina]